MLVPPTRSKWFTIARLLLLAGTATLVLGACASNRSSHSSLRSPDYSGLSQAQVQATVNELDARYRARPTDRQVIIDYAAALRTAGQPDQAVSVLESAMAPHGKDAAINIAYAKALAASGRFQQALTIIERTINPASPDWNALSVKGAILDQMGQNEAARALYSQAQISAPGEASLEANMGLSYAMTNDLGRAEQHLRRAVAMSTATSQIRQNLALIIGLQGRFDEARALYQRELPPDQVESNMAYIRALLTQQNRWAEIAKGDKK